MAAKFLSAERRRAANKRAAAAGGDVLGWAGQALAAAAGNSVSFGSFFLHFFPLLQLLSPFNSLLLLHFLFLFLQSKIPFFSTLSTPLLQNAADEVPRRSASRSRRSRPLLRFRLINLIKFNLTNSI